MNINAMAPCGGRSGCICTPGVTLTCPGDCSNCDFFNPDSCAYIPPGDVGDEFKGNIKEGDVNCFCMGGFIQFCEKNCTSCEHYPFETCAYSRTAAEQLEAENMNEDGDGTQGIPQGICVSTWTVFQGFNIESGCDSYAGFDFNPTPDPIVEDNASPPASDMAPNTTDTTSPTDRPRPLNNNKDDDDDPVCIDADALSHLSVSELVYNSHRRASVLCDRFGSCATPAHLVVYDGDVMTMRQYCRYTTDGGVGACRNVVKFVNSPRMRGLGERVRVRSKSPRLVYTALAAKYETRLEMSVLRLLVGIGF